MLRILDIHWPEIVRIKEGGFFGCAASTIRIDADDIVIGKDAFSCCSGIDSFTLVANHVTIGEYAFMYAKPMNTFTWALADSNAAGVKVTLEEGAFFSSNITSIHIPGDELIIGKDAFSCCSNIESFSTDSRTVSIGNSAFMYANKLKSFSAPNANSAEAAQKIDDYAFFSCGLASFTVPGCIQKIGKDAFSCCSSLKSVIIPSSVTTIGNGAFSLCDSSLVIRTEDGSAAEKYCESAWSVKCEYLTPSEISEIYGDKYAEIVAQARETAAEEAEAHARPANDVKSTLTHTKYSYMADKWNVYYATFLSDSTLKIERWNRWQAGANGAPLSILI